MNKLKKLSIAVVALAMCVLLGGAVWAVATNVTFDATPNQTTFCSTDKAQTVTVTVKANKQIGLFSLDADVVVPEGWTVAVTHPTLNDLAYANGNIVWVDDTLTNPLTDVLAVMTVTIPANTPTGTYTIGVENLEATKLNMDGSNWETEYWADGATVTTQIEVKKHEYVPGEYNWTADNSDCTVVGTCNCGATYTAHSAVSSSVTKNPTCTEKGETTYTATFAQPWAKQQVKVVADIPVKDHSFNNKVSDQLASAADCDNAATYYVQCDNCDAVDTTKTVAVGTAKGHAYPETPTSYTNNGDTHTEIFVCGNDASHVETKVNLPHDFTKGDCPCGAAKPGMKGDVDKDGDVDMDDVVALMSHVLSDVIITDQVALGNGEVTNDTNLNMDDVVKLMRYVLSDIPNLD